MATSENGSGNGDEKPGGTPAKAAGTQRSMELLWHTQERPARGPKPALTLERIVTAAVTLADAEGLDALSMRRLATDLGTGTMSLYRYVPGKPELLDLMVDRVQGEANDASPAAPDDDWRAAVGILAHAYLHQLRAHPWLLQLNQARTALGPNAVRGLELALRPLRTMGLSDPETMAVLITVNSYVEGLARMHVNEAEAARASGLTEEEFWGAQLPYLTAAMNSGAYPLMASLSEDTFGPGFDHFAFGLERLVAGFEALVDARRAGQ
ncbi:MULTISPECIES: TetR/AcrR family transcriptional regulator [Streptomyces]|uniref:TetR/AcrR family transcriptional regulator n=2 Tax=Streptomyces TaxID=1883 RepID=A0ACC7Y219_9ACTN|nr:MULTISPECIES: TetR/AcrR family transcriptional regulator [Streptomyces]NUV75875.1 TetR/AcrR family transcriptional regulator [Streptomyces fungicidicus]PAX82125.1 TetR family transcriptional regulator [Streptomyces albidoflavus]PBO20452.1 TetR family transcriptional regulator [Streptomyces albidoflavus]PBO25995.1 TetR family transcriptional regulator [Streptomyces albidoflavus]PBO27389.1 TetR family transcriptional regulator [Streptomyces albidoflavus]